MMYKQAIIVRKDLKMSAGKIAAQVAHASVEAWKKADKKIRDAWEREGAKKVVLQAQNEKELLELKKKSGKLPTALIRDAGLTEIPPGTITCLAIGPAREEEIDKLTGSLKLLSCSQLLLLSCSPRLH